MDNSIQIGVKKNQKLKRSECRRIKSLNPEFHMTNESLQTLITLFYGLFGFKVMMMLSHFETSLGWPEFDGTILNIFNCVLLTLRSRDYWNL